MNRHQKKIWKFKNLLKDIYDTTFFKYLNENYVPKVLKMDTDEDGNIITKKNGQMTGKATLVQRLPKIEHMAYTFSLMRQFILKKDDISIYKIGKHIKAIGSEEECDSYKESLDEFKKYANGLSGANYSSVDENDTVIRNKSFTRLELVNELFYGDMVHRDDDKFNIGKDLLAVNKIVEYLIGFLVYICRIANVIKFPDEDYSIYYDNCPEKLISGKSKN